MVSYLISNQLKLAKMRAELANLNHSAVPFLRRAAINLCWYYYNSGAGVKCISVVAIDKSTCFMSFHSEALTVSWLSHWYLDEAVPDGNTPGTSYRL